MSTEKKDIYKITIHLILLTDNLKGYRKRSEELNNILNKRKPNLFPDSCLRNELSSKQPLSKLLQIQTFLPNSHSFFNISWSNGICQVNDKLCKLLHIDYVLRIISISIDYLSTSCNLASKKKPRISKLHAPRKHLRTRLKAEFLRFAIKKKKKLDGFLIFLHLRFCMVSF